MKPHLSFLILAAALLAGCAHPALRQSDELVRANQLPQAWRVLDEAARANPGEHELRAAQLRLRDRLGARLIAQIEGLRASGRWDDARAALQQLREIDAKHPRVAAFEAELERGARQDGKIQQGRALLREGRVDRAEALAREIIAESPQHPGARLLLSQTAQARPLEADQSELGAAFQKPVTLEFREAPLRQVFEALARNSTINFVFDKDVRADAKVTVFLRNVTLDEAMRVILNTQQLDRKLLNENSVLIYPATSAKQREHQELITRTLYLTNADVKQVQALVRTIAKVRDVHVDERLNLLIVRDTPEVMRLVEKLVASVDLPEPEVMLEVEVMELSTDRLDALGLQWPEQIRYGLPNGLSIDQGQYRDLRASVANPAVVATLRGTAGQANLLANPKIRVRNRDKAKIHIGEKLPVFTTTAAVNIGVSASVTYLEIGLKLDVEPTVQLDNDVTIRIGLEVSNLLRQVAGPAGSIAYQVGTRQAFTSLRLNDGETQVLAGLISDEDRRSAVGVPGLQSMPLLGRLFGVHTDSRNKTEVVLLITPRVIRNLALPDAGLSRLPSGTDASPGAFSSLLKPSAKVGVGLVGGGGGAVAQRQAPAPVPQGADGEARVRFDVTPQIAAGGTASVTLKNESGLAVRGEFEFDASKLQPAQATSDGGGGRIAFELPPRGEKVIALRALPAAAGQVLAVGIGALSASGLNGETATVRLEGSGLIAVESAR